MSIVVHMDADDFERLLKTSADRAVMKIGPGRFDAGRDGEVNADWDWTTICWLGHDYAAVILARAFLAANGCKYEVLWDRSAPMDQPQRGWCILTDYEVRAPTLMVKAQGMNADPQPDQDYCPDDVCRAAGHPCMWPDGLDGTEPPPDLAQAWR